MDSLCLRKAFSINYLMSMICEFIFISIFLIGMFFELVVSNIIPFDFEMDPSGLSSTFSCSKNFRSEELYVPPRFLLVKLFFARLCEQRKGCFEPEASAFQ